MSIPTGLDFTQHLDNVLKDLTTKTENRVVALEKRANRITSIFGAVSSILSPFGITCAPFSELIRNSCRKKNKQEVVEEIFLEQIALYLSTKKGIVASQVEGIISYLKKQKIFENVITDPTNQAQDVEETVKNAVIAQMINNYQGAGTPKERIEKLTLPLRDQCTDLVIRNLKLQLQRFNINN